MLKRKRMKTAVVFLFAIFMVLVLPPSVLAKPAASADFEELGGFCDGFFPAKMSEYHVPGAAIVVVKDGKVLFSKGYGYANVGKKVPVDPRKTIFRVASVSKIFTIAGVLQLAEAGLVDVDQDVNGYLKNFQIKNDYQEPIRIKYLLTHTDGFETRDLATFVQDPADLLPLENVLKKDLNSPVQAPGSKITYGGYGTALAGYLISQVKNQPFEEYINNNIFKPLDMENSTFYQVLPDAWTDNISNVYNFDEDTNEFLPTQFLYVNTAPTGALSTTPEDMGKFLIALLNGGRYGESRILREDTVEKMLGRQYALHPSLPGVTYGFMESLRSGQRGLVRDGSGVGIRSQIFLLPEHDMGYFYVQNARGDELAEEFNDAFMDQFFPESDKEKEPENPAAPNQLSRYEGIYRPAQTAEHTLVKMEALAMGDLKITAEENGELTVTVLGEQDVYGGFPQISKWVETEPLLFRRVDQERYMAFQENEAGEIVNLASASGYHGSFDKIPWYESNRAQLYLLIFYIAVFLAGIIGNLIKFIRGKRDWLQISGVTALLFIVGISGAVYTLFLHRIAGFPAFAFGVSLPAKIMLTCLIAASILSIVFFVLLIRSWRSGKIKAFDKAFYSIAMVAFLGTVFWLHYWNLLGYQY